MKSLWKGVKRIMKASTEKVVTAVNGVFSDNEKARKLGLLVMGIGIGLGGGSIAMSYVTI